MTDLGDLIVSFKADLTNITAGINEVKDKVNSVTTTADQASGGFMGAIGKMGGSILSFANNATQMAGTIQQVGGAAMGLLSHSSDFESSMTALETGAGEAHKNLGLVSTGILNMTGQVGETTKDLSSGMYLIESAGQHGAQALTTLKDAAEGAKVGSADLASVANGVTTAMTDYSASGLTAAQATNDLIATVAAGKTHMADLASSFSSILPTAASVKVSFTDVSGAMATMTGEGTPAADAATYLRQTLMSLENPAAAGASALKNIGLTTKQVSDDMKVSLPDTLKLITDHLKSKFPEGSAAYVKALADISGGSRQMQGVLELTGSHLSVFEGNVTNITDAVKKGGDSITGWATVQGDFNQKMDEAKGSVEAVEISLGEKFLPIVGKVIDEVSPLVTSFADWISKSTLLGTAFDQIGAAFNAVMNPVKDVKKTFSDFYTYISPMDTSVDELSHSFHNATQVFAPLHDSVDSVMNTFKQAQKDAITPMHDAVDSLNKIVQQTQKDAITPMHDSVAGLTKEFANVHPEVEKTVQAVNPFVGIMRDLKPVLADIGSDFGILVSTVEVVATDFEKFGLGIAQSVLNSGALQSILHTIHDLLPDVSAFVERVGSDLDNNLLPPLEKLITNVGTTVKNFSDWLDKSGTAKMAIGLLGDAVDKTSGLIGTLVGWIADAVGWFNKGGPAADLVRDAILGIGGAIALIKLGEFVTNQVVGFIGKAKDAATAVFEWGGKMKDLGGNILDVAGKIKDGLVAAFDWAKGKIAGKGGATDEMSKGLDDVKQSEEDVGTTAKETMAKDVETGAAESEKSLAGIETKAGEVQTAEEGIGTTAKGEMATDVETGAAESEVAIEGIGTAATTTATDVEGIGTAATTAATTGDPELTAMMEAIYGVDASAKTTALDVEAIGPASTTAAGEVEAASVTMEGSLSGVMGKAATLGGMFLNLINLGEQIANGAGNATLGNANLQAEGAAEWKKVFGTLPMPDPSQMSASQLSQLYAAWQHDHPNEPFPFMHFGGGLASGGMNIPGGVYDVGEHGPERLYIPNGSAVVPSGGSGDVHVYVYLDGREVTNQIMTRAVKEIRRAGGLKAA